MPAAAQRAELEKRIQRTTLPNGLEVIVVPNPGVPLVTIEAAVRNGSFTQPPEFAGLSHLYEHMFFKANADYSQPDEFINRASELGAVFNGNTNTEVVNYYLTLPKDSIEGGMRFIASALKSPLFRQDELERERAVVIGEYDQRILAEPYGMLDELTNREAYTVHPYKRGVIGDPANLRAATLEDVMRFHRTYYRPDNAVLIVVGDFDPAQADAWVDNYFGTIAKPAGFVPRVTVVEPPQTAERTFTDAAANVPLPAIDYSYHVPGANAPDAAILDVIETLLGAGKSSRLYQSLVYLKQLATMAYASADLREQPGLFGFRAILSKGKSVADARAALDAEIARLQIEPVTAVELDRAKTQIASSFVRSRQTYNGIALALVRAAVERGDPGAVNEDLPRYLAVTAVDVQRVAQTYFTVPNRTVIEYLPAVSA